MAKNRNGDARGKQSRPPGMVRNDAPVTVGAMRAAVKGGMAAGSRGLKASTRNGHLAGHARQYQSAVATMLMPRSAIDAGMTRPGSRVGGALRARCSQQAWAVTVAGRHGERHRRPDRRKSLPGRRSCVERPHRGRDHQRFHSSVGPPQDGMPAKTMVASAS